MSVISGIFGASASKSAANTSADASNRAADLAYQANQEATNINAPYVAGGENALAEMIKMQKGDYSSFYPSPGYQWTKDQGMQGIQRAASATGRLGSGGYIKDATRFAEGIASQEFGNFWNRWQNIYQGGQSAAARTATNTLASANTVGQLYQDAGNAQASGTLGVMNAGTNALRNIGQQALNQYYQNPSATYGQNSNSMSQYSQYGYNPNWTASGAEMDMMSWL